MEGCFKFSILPVASSDLGVNELTQVCQVCDTILIHDADPFMLGLVVLGDRVVCLCQDHVPLPKVLVGLVYGHTL